MEVHARVVHSSGVLHRRLDQCHPGRSAPEAGSHNRTLSAPNSAPMQNRSQRGARHVVSRHVGSDHTRATQTTSTGLVPLRHARHPHRRTRGIVSGKTDGFRCDSIQAAGVHHSGLEASPRNKSSPIRRGAAGAAGAPALCRLLRGSAGGANAVSGGRSLVSPQGEPLPRLDHPGSGRKVGYLQLLFFSSLAAIYKGGSAFGTRTRPRFGAPRDPD